MKKSIREEKRVSANVQRFYESKLRARAFDCQQTKPSMRRAYFSHPGERSAVLGIKVQGPQDGRIALRATIGTFPDIGLSAARGGGPASRHGSGRIEPDRVETGEAGDRQRTLLTASNVRRPNGRAVNGQFYNANVKSDGPDGAASRKHFLVGLNQKISRRTDPM
jgi:hypothetical protein